MKTFADLKLALGIVIGTLVVAAITNHYLIPH